MTARLRRDGGFGSVWVLICVLVLGAASGLAAVRGAATVVRHRAAAAADAAALAAAGTAADGRDAACRQAERIAAADGAEMVACTVAGLTATVTTRVHPPPWLAWAGPACGRARAGQIPADRQEPLEAGQRRNLGTSTSLCPVSKRE